MGNTKTPFAPVVMFTARSDHDRTAVRLAHLLYGEVRSTMDTDRNRQKSIGLSEIGGECRKCLARKLSGTADDGVVDASGWKAMVGTFVHAGLETHIATKYPEPGMILKSAITEAGLEAIREQFRQAANDIGAIRVEFFTERDLHVLNYKTLHLTGHCDLYVRITMPDASTFGVVVDWKCLGDSTLGPKRTGKMGETYDHQLDGYGLGYELLGENVEYVLLAAVPRDDNLNGAAFVLRPYNKQRIVDRLAVLTSMIDAAEIMGWEAFINSQPKAGHCFDCKRYEAAESTSFFAGFQSQQ